MVPDPVEVIDLTELTDSSDDGEDLDADQDDSQSSSEDEDGSSEGGEVAIDATSRAALHQAISSVSERQLRQVIANLVDTVPAVERAMTRELVSFHLRSREAAPRWETCGNCGEEYDLEVKREPNECNFHPGEIEVDEACFVDWDEDCHGPMDTLANRRAYPENFLWTCCEENTGSGGCVIQEHMPAVPRKKQRL
ncbi:uncharacterized protein BT62DRAFT_981521 [Guyanagaster necrorhizus]|uniref:Uncharacterized protein n=1 Tax=Guyanagaster necrorhizus TaxID=856835 RepID=A0A9P7VQ59_9AGAR|nr:uncharacterized protein BT62DRAFT_981521 [Guyanagaster necrorhizus MCA 3950]KAG7444752.1 hypothetical protein BT62DRAFT_981521 [Guyanagaster necrorhizus MCA 3950]